MIDETTGGAHDDLGALTQGPDLPVDGRSAIDGEGPEFRKLRPEALQLGANLDGEFPCRTDHEHLGIRIVPVDPGEAGEAESSRFSRTCLGETDNIFPRESKRDGGDLNMRGLFVAELFDSGEEGVGETELGKSGMIHSKDGQFYRPAMNREDGPLRRGVTGRIRPNGQRESGTFAGATRSHSVINSPH